MTFIIVTIAGIMFNPLQITYMDYSSRWVQCRVNFSSTQHRIFKDMTCAEVIMEIDRQIAVKTIK